MNTKSNELSYRIIRKTYATGRLHFYAEYRAKKVNTWHSLNNGNGFCTQPEAADAIQKHKNQFVFKEEVVWSE